MTYNPATDFIALFRTITGGVSKLELPGLDFVVAALGRAGLLNVTVSGLPPTANQATTAWFQPASPSYSAEGALWLWNANTSAYAAATPSLFYQFLSAVGGASGFSVWSGTGGPPANTLGNNGDIYHRTDTPGGVYLKAGGAWSAQPLPGTSYSQTSTALDTLGNAQGSVLYRGASGWAVLTPGAAGQVLTSSGVGANPAWSNLSSSASSAALDTAFGSATGNMLYRSATAWQSLAIGALNNIMTVGAGNVPAWSSLTAELDAVMSSTIGAMLYRGTGGWQAIAPGTSGYVLTSQGSGSAPIWAAGGGGGGVTSAAMDAAFGATVGGILIRGTAGWTNMGAGTAGQLLQTNGGGNNPSWVNSPAGQVGTPLGVGSFVMANCVGAGTIPTVGTQVTTSGTVVLSYYGLSGTPTAISAGQTWRCMGAIFGSGTADASTGYSSALWFRVS